MANAEVAKLDDATPRGIAVDCSSGRVVHIPLTAEDVAGRQAEFVRHTTARQAEMELRQQLIATVAASADPAVQALATLLGLVPHQGAAA